MRLLAAAAAVNWATEALTTKHTRYEQVIDRASQTRRIHCDDEKSVNLPGEERERESI